METESLSDDMGVSCGTADINAAFQARRLPDNGWSAACQSKESQTLIAGDSNDDKFKR
jgi:hypothetical protein